MKYLKNITVSRLNQLTGIKFISNNKGGYVYYYYNNYNNQTESLFAVGPTEYLSLSNKSLIDILNRCHVDFNTSSLDISKNIIALFLEYAFPLYNFKLKKHIKESVFQLNTDFYVKHKKRYFKAYMNTMFHLKDIDNNKIYLAPEICLAIHNSEIVISQHQDINIISLSITKNNHNCFKEIEKDKIDQLPEIFYNIFSEPVLNVPYSKFCSNKSYYLALLQMIDL